MNADHVKHIVDGVAISAWLAALMGWLPAIAAALSIVWTAIRIYETRTVQRWLGRRAVFRTRTDD